MTFVKPEDLEVGQVYQLAPDWTSWVGFYDTPECSANSSTERLDQNDLVLILAKLSEHEEGPVVQLLAPNRVGFMLFHEGADWTELFQRPA